MDEAILSSVLHEAKENRMVLSFINDEFIGYKERMEKEEKIKKIVVKYVTCLSVCVYVPVCMYVCV